MPGHRILDHHVHCIRMMNIQGNRKAKFRGQILLNVAETIKGSAFSTQTRERILRGGLLIIGLLFVTVMFNDISRNMQNIVRLLGKLFGRSA